MVSMDSLIRLLFEKKASDLHLTAGSPPMLRIDGEIVATDGEKLKSGAVGSLLESILIEDQKEQLRKQRHLEMSFGIEKTGRVRVTIFQQQGEIAATLRAIPWVAPSFEDLTLPNVVNDIVQVPKGLVLITGPAGSGRSTTIAAMLNWINEHKAVHILTLESPLEFIHPHKKAIVNQREIGSDVPDYSAALKQAPCQNPDVVLAGDMSTAANAYEILSIAETGHLVFATVNRPDSLAAITHIINLFPPQDQPSVRTQLAGALQAVVAQQLLPRGYSSGRVLATEVLIPTSAVRNLIREEKEYQVYSMMQAGSEYGMQTMNQALFELYQKQLVTYNEIFSRTTDPKDLQSLVKGTT